MVFFKEIINKLRLKVCLRNYKNKLEQIYNYPQNVKIKILFYVTENSKWGYQSLYEEFENSDLFEPLVVVSILNEVHKGKDKTRNILEENYNFFKSHGMNVEYAYKNGKYLDLKRFKPDIIFYEQPWGIPNKYKPQIVSKYALTCYCDYGFEIFNNKNYTKNFHFLLWKFFVDSSTNIKRYKSYDKSFADNCISCGYPKLDVYFDKINTPITDMWLEPQKIKIIYAPHHSFDSNGLRLATFKENGKLILDYAKNHPETTWVFKPHPLFKFALLQNGIMTEEEINSYYKDWESFGKIYTKGDYFDIFRTSDILLTDCASFLGEYLPTLKPIIRPCNKNAETLNELGQEIASSCYCTHSNNDLEKILNDIVNKKFIDSKYEERKQKINLIIDINNKSSNKICEFIKEEILR